MKTIVDNQRIFFNTNQTKDIEFRLAHLQKLKKLIKAYEPKLNEAIYQDFRKSAFDIYSAELAIIYAELDGAIRNIKKWAKRKRMKTNLINFPASSYILPEPLGVCLVIGPWNYPIQLSLIPAISALAAGNTVILKPSELTAQTSHLLAQMINVNFDPSYFKVIEGGAQETEELLRERFDKIFFTGSANVGRVVYQAAAKHLTPVTLELGGKSPAILLEDCNLEMCVKRLIWAKFLNAGQTCVAPDYVIMPRSMRKRFVEMAIQEIKREQFAIENHNYVQIINEKNLLRLAKMVDNEKLCYGGTYSLENRTMEPTLMMDVTFEDKVMQEEIFGPILPILTYDTLEEAILQIKKGGKPLSCYLFTQNKPLRDKILRELSFGGGAINDAIMHLTNSNLPFGGVGESGMGSYHGVSGFNTFSHFKSILEKPTWFELNLKYYPHTESKLKWLKFLFKFS